MILNYSSFVFFLKGSMEPTAYANWDVLHELEFTIGKVLGHGVLDDLMKDKGAMRLSLFVSIS